MTKPITSDLLEATNGGRNLDPSPAESHRHPISTSIGAILAAGTAGTTGGVLVGPVGAIVGAVVGAVAGGLGGQALGELVDPTGLGNVEQDTYTSRTHHLVDPPAADSTDEDSNTPETGQSPREAWGRLDQSSKDLLTDPPPSSSE